MAAFNKRFLKVLQALPIVLIAMPIHAETKPPPTPPGSCKEGEKLVSCTCKTKITTSRGERLREQVLPVSEGATSCQDECKKETDKLATFPDVKFTVEAPSAECVKKVE